MYCMNRASWLNPVTVLSSLCPSPTVPNLLPNEVESTIRVCSGGHSWSFQSIHIHSNSVFLMRVVWAGEYESFEHVQKLCVASANKFRSCLCALKTCSYRVCRTADVLYSSHSHYILIVFWLFLLYTRSFLHVGETGASCEWTRYCCKVDIHVHIRVNSPLSYTWHVDFYTFLLFSYSIRFILVRSCEILGRTE